MSDAESVWPQADGADVMQKDGDVLSLIAGGDVATTFALVMARYQGKVYRLCVAYLRDPAWAQDVAQDSLVRVWRALPRYDGRAALSTFIYVITRNRCLTALGGRRTEASLCESAVQTETARQDSGDALRQLVDELPDTTRRIVMLYYFEDESITEVAALVGLPDGTIKTHLFRARRVLRSRLKVLGMADMALWLVSRGAKWNRHCPRLP